jgi:5-methylcytosine-specific restriction endonuclease McrA
MKKIKDPKVLEADQLCSKIVRSRGFCQRCGKTNISFDTAHVIRRAVKVTRWDLKNLLCLCHECHMWSHKQPNLFMRWFESKYTNRYEYLQQKLSSSDKTDVSKLIKKLKKHHILASDTSPDAF